MVGVAAAIAIGVPFGLVQGASVPSGCMVRSLSVASMIELPPP
jgi:hypothetical protein